MFRIKICGITNSNDARVAADAGADAIGLNFFKKSKRYVEPETARRIVDSLPPAISKVGVFVNHSPEEIVNIVDAVGIDCIQLHGDEPATIFAKLPRRLPIIRAFRSEKDGLAMAVLYLEETRKTDRGPDAFLMDSDAGADYGGIGKLADWEQLPPRSYQLFGLPLLLAGGLNPSNVGDAIATVQPDGVDVASGVEQSRGVKDPKLISQFVRAARRAFEEYPPMRY